MEKGKAIVERNFRDMLSELQQITKSQPIFNDLPELKKAFVSLTTSATPGVFKLNDYLIKLQLGLISSWIKFRKLN